MALSNSELRALAVNISAMIDALEAGMTPEWLRRRAREDGISPSSAEAWVKLATIAHEGMREAPLAVTNPRFRKGTAMKPVAWADCLWRPAP